MRKAALPLLILIAVAAYVGHWFYVAGRVPEAVADWAEGLRANGFDVRYGAIDVGGFPLKLAISVADVAIEGRLGDLGWAWTGPKVTALARPWRFDRLLIALPPVHALVLTQAGRASRVDLGQDTNQIAVVAGGDGLEVLGFDATGLRLADETGATIAAATFKLRYEAEGEDGGENLGLQIERLLLPEAPAGFPTQVASFTTVLALAGDIPAGPMREALGAWRDSGGTIDARRFHLVWGALDVEGDGTLALDALFRPIAAWNLRVAGYAEALESAVAAGAMEPAPATAARAVLDLAAKPDAAGGPTRADIALTVQDGTVYVGPIAVGRVGPLVLD
jgi:hypothetical protein